MFGSEESFVKVQLFRKYSWGQLFSHNVIGGVTSYFQHVSSGGDHGSRMLFAGERGGGRNATTANLLKIPVTETLK